MEFSEKLRNLRKDSGLSQEELAEQMGVSRQAVSKWENGQGFPETEKLLMMGSLFNVSLDYLLKSDEGTNDTAPSENGYYVSREMAQGYLAMKKRGAFRIALGVGIIIASLCLPMTVDKTSLGGMLFLFGAAIGIAILVSQNFAPKQYQQIEKEPLLFDEGVLRALKGAHANERRRYGYYTVAGIFLVIMGMVVPGVLEEFFPTFLPQPYALLFPLCVSFAVALFIIAGSASASYGVLINNKEHTQEETTETRYGWIYGAVMPLAGICFLAIGLMWNLWHPGWLIFPLAALGCNAYIAFRNSKDKVK